MEFSATVEIEVECRSVTSSRRSKGSRRSNNSRRRRSAGGRGGSCHDNEDGNPYLFFTRDAEVEVDEEGFALPSSRPSTSKAKSASSSAYRPKSLFASSTAGSAAPYRKAAVASANVAPHNKKLRKKLNLSSEDGNSSDSAAECGWQAFCAQSSARRRGHQSSTSSTIVHTTGIVNYSDGGAAAAAAALLRTERRLSPMPSPSLLPTIELLPGATNVVVETDLCAFFLEGCS